MGSISALCALVLILKYSVHFHTCMLVLFGFGCLLLNFGILLVYQKIFVLVLVFFSRLMCATHVNIFG